MIKFTIFLCCYFAINLVDGTNSQTKLPICVVGGGFSGLNVGILLQNKGYNVHVFEKLDRVGGKANTFRIGNDVLAEMCPLFYVTSATSLLAYIQKFKLTSIPFNEDDKLNFDSQSGIILPQTLTAAQLQELELAVARFAAIRATYTKDFDYGYVNARPELYDSIEQWLTRNNLTALTPILEFVITAEGYGALEDTAALYMLKLVSAEFLNGLVDPAISFMTLYEGLSVLVDKMASLIKNVHLSHELFALLRNGDHQIAYFKNGNSFQSMTCAKTILAFPPLLSNLQNIIPDLTSFERSVLSHVKISKYASAAHHLPNLNTSIYGEAFTLAANKTLVPSAPLGNGEVAALVKQSTRKTQNVFTSYSWIRGDYDTLATSGELNLMTRSMDATLRKMSPKPTVLHPIKTTEYFPHVSPQSMRQGFFKNFTSIQGNEGVYFLTTLDTFEVMDFALKGAESFVEKYFG